MTTANLSQEARSCRQPRQPCGRSLRGPKPIQPPPESGATRRLFELNVEACAENRPPHRAARLLKLRLDHTPPPAG